VKVASAKVGPDYIDPAFHAAATGRPCLNLDTWAMRPATLAGLAGELGRDAEMIVAEGVMGLFDGAMVPGGIERDGSTAALAR
jgi:cobyrinic acid a,c-diamide synthase